MPHFIGHHGKATALLAGAGGFNGGVEGQQIGLVGNAANGIDDGGDLLRAFAEFGDQLRRGVDIHGDFAHAAGGFLNHLGAFFRHLLGVQRQVVSLGGALCVSGML